MDPGRIVEILSTLVAFDTTSRNSNLALIEWVEGHLAPLGFTLERVPDPTGLKANLWATIGPADVPGFVLSGHTDVVPVDGQDWTSDPFTLRRDGTRLYGRGACDMKGFLAVCLERAARMAERPLRQPIHLAFSYDEEVGCVGAGVLARRLAQRGFRAEACFVGEPTSMGVVLGHKGKRSVRARVRGLACHSSLAPRGVNAVQYGARLAGEVFRIADRIRREGPFDDLYDVPHSTGHVGVMKGGTALNIVPDLCELVFEFRTVGEASPDTLVEEVARFARDELEPEMRAVDPASGIDFDVYAGFPGLDTPADAPVVTLAKSLAGRNGHAKVSYGTEGGLFHQVAGLPTVIVGPGSIEQAHKPDEWVEEGQLLGCAAFVDRVIDRARG
jgi:acetylornithine deacetylase